VDSFWHPSSATNVLSGRDVANYNDLLHPAFHPGPVMNWMNDPNGPMYFNNLYHLFYQYNPYGSAFENESWGHDTSEDLVHWTHQPVAMFEDQPYDKGGVWSGSAVVANGIPTLVYTCVNGVGQQQCIATASNLTDPFLVNWTKSSANPVIKDPPPGGNSNDFRDDVTPWQSNGTWWMILGVNINGTGAAFLYSSPNSSLTQWTPQHIFWTLPVFGNMWECPDFYPIKTVNGPQDKASGFYGLKFSALGRDWYALGTYDETNQLFNPVTSTHLYDGGQFYASKSFYDPKKDRQILYGWIAEDGGPADSNGWQGVQSFPRQLTYDQSYQQLVTPPIEEIALLRTSTPQTVNTTLGAGKFLQLNPGNQLDIVATFSVSNASQQTFGFRVLESSDGTQYTDAGVVVYGSLYGPLNNTEMPVDEYRQFYYDNSTPTEDERVALCQSTCQKESLYCASWSYVRQGWTTSTGSMDPSPRCSLKNGVPVINVPNNCCVSGTLSKDPFVGLFVNRGKSGSGNSGNMYNSAPMAGMDTEQKLQMEILVDHSILELYVGNGRSVLTSRVYPTKQDNFLSVFNTGSASLSVNLTVYPLSSSDPTTYQ
jgi:sucrose-6-phosphate hydrolase SacC (GH32 family)